MLQNVSCLRVSADDCCYHHRNYPNTSATMRKKESKRVWRSSYFSSRNITRKLGVQFTYVRNLFSVLFGALCRLGERLQLAKRGPGAADLSLTAVAAACRLIERVPAGHCRSAQTTAPPTCPHKKPHSVWVGLKTHQPSYICSFRQCFSIIFCHATPWGQNYWLKTPNFLSSLPPHKTSHLSVSDSSPQMRTSPYSPSREITGRNG